MHGVSAFGGLFLDVVASQSAETKCGGDASENREEDSPATHAIVGLFLNSVEAPTVVEAAVLAIRVNRIYWNGVGVVAVHAVVLILVNKIIGAYKARVVAWGTEVTLGWSCSTEVCCTILGG